MAIHTIIIRIALAIVVIGNLHQLETQSAAETMTPTTAGDARPAVPQSQIDARAVNLDDCLAKAVAQQPYGRPIEPLVTDLFHACQFELFALKSSLKSQGKTDHEVIDEIYDHHVAPMALRAKPM